MQFAAAAFMSAPSCAGTPQAAEPGLLHERLIEELTTAQRQIRAEPPAQYAEQPLIYAEPAAQDEAEPAVHYSKPLDYTEPAVEYPAFEEPQYTTFELTDQDVAFRPELISSALPEETVSEGTGCGAEEGYRGFGRAFERGHAPEGSRRRRWR